MALKQQTIKKLHEICKVMQQKCNNDNLTEQVTKMVGEVIFFETKATSDNSVFNLYDYTLQDAKELINRPAYGTVYHDNGYEVATSGHILVAIKSDYDKSLEGKAIDKYGNVCDSRFPRWKNVIPSDKLIRQDYKAVAIEPDDVEKDFQQWISKVRAEHKAETGKSCKFSDDWFVKLGDVYLSAAYFVLFLKALRKIDAHVVYYKGFGMCVAAKTKAGIALLMTRLFDGYKYQKVFEL